MTLNLSLDQRYFDREFRLNNLGELEQFLGGEWCAKTSGNH